MLASSFLLLLGLSFSSISSTFAAPYDPKACNNSPDLCSKRWSEILHLGAHDSPFVRDQSNGFSLSGNQYFNVTTQLDAGVRLLQGQVHPYKGKTKLCHSDCRYLLDAGPLGDYLSAVKGWMDKHTSEVITMLLVNNKNIPVSTLKPIFEDSGLASLSYIPPANITPTTWPTLQTLIDSKKRIIIFLSNAANQTAVPYLLDEFKYLFETPFEVTDPDAFTCNAHRPASVGGKDKLKQAVDTKIPLMNRFMYAPIIKRVKIDGVEMFKPNDTYAVKLNGDDSKAPGNLKMGVEKCYKEYGKKGGFVLLDFFNEGSPINVVDHFNNVTKPVNRKDPGPTPKKVKKKPAEKVKDLVENIKDGKTQNVGIGRVVSTFGDLVGKIGRRLRSRAEFNARGGANRILVKRHQRSVRALAARR